MESFTDGKWRGWEVVRMESGTDGKCRRWKMTYGKGRRMGSVAGWEMSRWEIAVTQPGDQMDWLLIRGKNLQ